MRAREIIRDRKRSADTNVPLDAETVERYIQAYQCPYCQDGLVYKMLPLHIARMHSISAYDLRERFGMNRGHKLTSHETSELMGSKHQPPNAAFMAYDRQKSILHRYEDGRQRDEAIKTKQVIARTPEARHQFRKVMAGIDRKAIAATIPSEIRKARGRHARMVWGEKVSLKRQKEIMALARSLRTPESDKLRIQHAQGTMRRYWNDKDWCSRWRKRITEARQANAKVPRSAYAAIVSLYESGISQGKIASEYGVSRSLICLIIKSQKLGLLTLQRKT